MSFLSSILDGLRSPMGILLLILGLIVLYFLFIYENRMDKMLKKFPGPVGIPIFGNVWTLRNADENIARTTEWRQKYGDRFVVRIGLYRHVTVLSPADVEKVLTSNLLLEKGQVYSKIQPWLGKGLLIIKNERWQQRRKMINPAFHKEVLQGFLPLFNDHAQILVEVLGQLGANGKTVELDTPLTRCALDIMCETAMGTKLNIQKNENDAYWKASVRQTQLIYERWGRPFYESEFLWSLSFFGREDKANLKILHGFRDRIIREKKEQFLKERQNFEFLPTEQVNKNDDQEEKKPQNKLALLDLLLTLQANGGPTGLTDHEIREEVDTLLFEGHDNTAVSLTWTTFLLALHPEHQATVHAELDSIFGDDKTRPVTSEDMSKMKFLGYCINESLRLFPTVPVISRKVNEDFYLDDNTVVPKGANLSVGIALVHRNPEVFPQPDEFRPSRFFPENAAGRHPYAFVPFSGGPRNCIGQRFGFIKIKLVLAHLFRSFRVETNETFKTVKIMPQIISRPKEEIHVKLFPR